MTNHYHERQEHGGDGPCAGCAPAPYDPRSPRALERRAFVANVLALLALPPVRAGDGTRLRRAVYVDQSPGVAFRARGIAMDENRTGDVYVWETASMAEGGMSLRFEWQDDLPPWCSELVADP